MKINSINLVDYRSYNRLDLRLSGGINLFIGENGSGKTNLLEAVGYCAVCRSFRTTNDKNLVNYDAALAAIAVEVERAGVATTTVIKIDRHAPRTIETNGAKTTLKDHIGRINIVTFSPQNLDVIKGPPERRRKYIDIAFSQSSPAYLQNLIEYHKVLQQRTKLANEIEKNEKLNLPNDYLLESLAVWDEKLKGSGGRLIEKRLCELVKLSGATGEIAGYITDGREKLNLTYQSKNYKETSTPRSSLLTPNFPLPHRDEIVITNNEEDLRKYGSQGQQRTAALALALAQVKYLQEATGENPVLLLDDVMSELDRARREKLLQFIRDGEIQTIITATDKAYFDDIITPADTVFKVRDGRITKI